MASMVVLTGASGAGKTTVARAIEKLGLPDCEVHFFDSIGVPTAEERQREYGTGHEPGGGWQRAMTLEWVRRMRVILDRQTSVLLEGQMRIAFIQEALAQNRISRAHILLLDCDDATRAARLHLDRAQPELANADMMNWAAYLRREAVAAGVRILDTGRAPLEECVDGIALWLRCGGGESLKKG